MNAGMMTATPESTWAAIQESNRILTEKQAETERMLQETDRFLKESKAETDRMIKEIRREMGSWSTNQGAFAEEYFINSFEKGQKNFFGEQFDKMIKNAKGVWIDAEYDIVLVNGKSIGIVEVKYKAHINDLPELFGKAQTFRVNYPYYANHQIYLGLASLSFYSELEYKCISEGIAMIKQVGDTVVVNDKHLKVF